MRNWNTILCLLATGLGVLLGGRPVWCQDARDKRPQDLASVFESYRDGADCEQLEMFPAPSVWPFYGVFSTSYSIHQDATLREGGFSDYLKEAPIPQLYELGATVTVSPEIEPNLNAFHVFVGSNWEGDDRDLRLLRRIRHVVQVVFSYAPISDAGLEHLTRLAALTDLELRHTRITDAGLETLGRIPSLRRLTILEESVTPAAIVKLVGKLPSLTRLRLDAAPIQFERVHEETIRRNKPKLTIVSAGPYDTDPAAAPVPVEPESLLGWFEAGFRENNVRLVSGLAKMNSMVSLVQPLAQLPPYWDPMQYDEIRFWGTPSISQELQGKLELDLAKHRQALKEFRQAGVDVQERWNEEHTRVAVFVGFSKTGQKTSKLLAQLPLSDLINVQVVSFDLMHVDLTDADLQALARGAASVRSLELVSTRMTDRGLESIGQLDRLQELKMSASEITPAGVEQMLARLPRLRSLRLHASLIGLTAADAKRMRTAFPAVEFRLR